MDDEHVNKAEANNTDFYKGFRAYYQQCMAAVWSRPGLTKRELSLIAIAPLVASGHQDFDGDENGRSNREDGGRVCRNGGPTVVSSAVFLWINNYLSIFIKKEE